MKLENIEPKHMEVIRHIVSTGVGIVYIDQELFLVHQFAPADGAVRKTLIQGLCITNLVNNQALGVKVSFSQQQLLSTQLSEIASERREYSEHFKWILYS